jgi:hypothetical protein
VTVVDVHALLARLADGDPALILPALVAAVVLLAVAGVADLFARDPSIEARLATGVSRSSRTGPACQCGAMRHPDAADEPRPRQWAMSGARRRPSR